MKKRTKIPKNLQGILWSVDVKDLDLKRSQSYIINQILGLGILEELKWLFKTYPKTVIKRIFLQQPDKVYSFSRFNFCKNILLKLENINLPLNRYVKTLPRDIRS